MGVSNFGPLFLALAASDGGSDYAYDDGQYEGAYGNPGISAFDFCWMHRFDADGGMDVLTEVSVVFGRIESMCGPPNGTPVNICVWDDPNNDGSPEDARLLTNVPGVVMNTNEVVFNVYEIPPTPVTGSFFVGCYLTLDISTCAAPFDVSASAPTWVWVVCNVNPGQFDPECLPANGCGPYDFREDLGFPAVFLLRASGTACMAGEAYCTAKANSCAGVPSISATGSPKASASSGFVVVGANTRAQKSGLLLYTNAGPAAIPFDGGLLCVAPPVRRTAPVIDGNGTPMQCDGELSMDMNAFAQGLLGGNPGAFLREPGARVHCQWWGRDSVSHGSLLTDALEYIVCP